MNQVSSREFLKGFKKLTSSLAGGQTVKVTKRGKPIGFFTKAGGRSVPMPDFAANLATMPYSEATGERVLQKYLHDSVS